MRTQPLVLLVDDEDQFLEIASLKLKGNGFDTVTTNDGHDAITKAETLLPDLILSDIYMVPGPNGWELALALRRNAKTRNIKLAFFTTLRDPWLEIPQSSRADILAELGEVTFLSKIDDVEKLGQKISQLIKV